MWAFGVGRMVTVSLGSRRFSRGVREMAARISVRRGTQ
jgi:hypothetical protein